MARKILAATLALGLAGCAGSSTATPDSGLDDHLTVGQLTSDERAAFCSWVTAPSAGCGLSGTGQSFYAPVAPEDACVEQFGFLPDCSIGAYEACQVEQLASPCTATASEACRALASCAPIDVPGSGGDKVVDLFAAYTVCYSEITLAYIGRTVWEIRRRNDGCDMSAWRLPWDDTTAYCIEYTVNFDHYRWKAGLMQGRFPKSCK